eukprot:5172686-Karenia_brevis.AAC.1
MKGPWTVDRGSLPDINILQAKRSTLHKAARLGVNCTLARSIEQSNKGEGRLDLSGVTQDNPIDRRATR